MKKAIKIILYITAPIWFIPVVFWVFIKDVAEIVKEDIDNFVDKE